MFNSAGTALRYSNGKILYGPFWGDYASHKTLYAGPDPADQDRVLIRKALQINGKTWAFEETRVSPAEVEGGKPTVHSKAVRLSHLDLNENISDRELYLRSTFRPISNIIGISLFHKSGSFFVTENSFAKLSYYRWSEWLKDVQDTRDLSFYLWMRWLIN